jgi:hypothetical protein
MATPTPIEQLTAEFRQVDHDIEKMRIVLNKAASNSAHADELEKIAADELALLTAERARLVAAAGSDRALRIVERTGGDVKANYDAIDARIRAATDRLAECTVAAQSLREIHVGTLNGLKRLEATRRNIEAALREAKNEARAERIAQHAAELNKMIDELADQYPSDLDRPINVPRRVPSPAIEAALAMRPGSDWLNTPISKLRARM